MVGTDGTVRHPGLDNHRTGTVLEELIRRFNKENNEEAGEHFAPWDAVTLMAKLVFLPIAHRIESATCLLYEEIRIWTDAVHQCIKKCQGHQACPDKSPPSCP